MIRPAYVCLFTPSPEIDEEELERFLTKDVFPTLEVFQRNVQGTAHSLFKSQGENEPLQYIWMLGLDLVGVGTATGGVDKVYDMMKEKLESYGTLSAPFAQIASKS